MDHGPSGGASSPPPEPEAKNKKPAFRLAIPTRFFHPKNTGRTSAEVPLKSGRLGFEPVHVPLQGIQEFPR